jgi:hypothetical protein
MTIEPITPNTPEEKKALDQAVREVNYAKGMYEISAEKEQALLKALYDVHVYRINGEPDEIDRLSKIAFGILQECPLKPKGN